MLTLSELRIIDKPRTFGTEGVIRVQRSFLLALEIEAHGTREKATVLLSARQCRSLALDLQDAADEADDEAKNAWLRDGIDSGDLDHDGNAIPYPKYRAA